MQTDAHDPTHVMGKLLRTHREKKGIRQADIAQKIKRSSTYISKYELAEIQLSPFELYKICNALGISFATLMKQYESEVKRFNLSL